MMAQSTLDAGTADTAVPVLNRPDVGGWSSALWPLLVLGLLLALLIHACVDQPTLAPRFDAAQTAKAANAQALDALRALPQDAPVEARFAALNRVVVLFMPGSAQLAEEAEAPLQVVAQALQRLPADARVRLVGHTDNQGSALRNIGLSLHRAQAVREALVRLGVDAAQLEVSGAGASRPVTSNASEAGRFANQRIEFLWIESE